MASYPSYLPAKAAFSTWMYRVAMNVAISTQRQSGLRAGEHLPLDELGIDLAEAELVRDSRSDNMRTLDRLLHELDEPSCALVPLLLWVCRMRWWGRWFGGGLQRLAHHVAVADVVLPRAYVAQLQACELAQTGAR